MILIRINPDLHMARFYRIDLQPDLFGGVVLIRNWGRIGAQGQERREWFSDPAAAESAQNKWQTIKERRGYRVAA